MEKELCLKTWYLSRCIVVLSWRIRRNCNRMGRLIDGGEAYTSKRLLKLNDSNQRMGQRLHQLLLTLLKARGSHREDCPKTGLVTERRQWAQAKQQYWNHKADEKKWHTA